MVLWALRWGLSREEAGGQEWVVLAGGKAAVALRRVLAQEHRARLRHRQLLSLQMAYRKALVSWTPSTEGRKAAYVAAVLLCSL